MAPGCTTIDFVWRSLYINCLMIWEMCNMGTHGDLLHTIMVSFAPPPSPSPSPPNVPL